ncbi:MAG: hypothetical protein K2X91_04185 [Thermoleophilia bacterium]|nr:hypothetical protein [Thermoleophilia bacterium]
MKLSRLFALPSLAAVLIGAMVLASCATVAPPGGPPGSSPSPVVSAAGTLTDERALYALEAAYNVAAHAYVTADDRGQLSAELKARIRPALTASYAALRAARAAHAAGNADSFATQAAAVVRFANEARALIPT